MHSLFYLAADDLGFIFWSLMKAMNEFHNGAEFRCRFKEDLDSAKPSWYMTLPFFARCLEAMWVVLEKPSQYENVRTVTYHSSP